MTVLKIHSAANHAACDFEFLAVLAKNDPVAFEEMREKIIQEFIEASGDSKQEMLIRFQWRIDQTRRQAKNPYHALIKLSEMMWKSLGQLESAQNQLVAYVFDEQPIEKRDFELVSLDDFKKRRRIE